MTIDLPESTVGEGAQIVALVAHELRYPLVPIRNAAALLRDATRDPDTVWRAAEIIERETNNMNRLIGDLVDVSRMQMGALEFRRQRAPLSELVERAVESAGALARQHGHRLSVSLPPEPVYLHMDVLRLSQALHNVIVNACKYTDKYGEVNVRARRHDSQVTIVVSDTGIGIAAAALEAIFGLFVKAEQGERMQAGLGLGLYLARHFVEAHGGVLHAASAGANRGSEFTIGLPCESSTATVPASEDGEPAVDRFPA